MKQNKPTQPTELKESLNEVLTRIQIDIDSGKYDKYSYGESATQRQYKISKAEQFRLDCLRVGISELELPYRYEMLVDLDTQIAEIQKFTEIAFELHDANKPQMTDTPLLGLFMHGAQGLGKSHCLVCMCKRFVKKAKAFSCKYVKASDIFLEIRNTYNPNPIKTELQIIESYRGIRYLFIDDIGSGSNSNAERNALLQILDGRQRNLKLTMLTSNMDIPQLGKFIGLRESSRFKVYENIHFQGSDRRSSKNIK